MSKHKNLKRNLLICLLAGSAVMYTLPLHAATSVVANNALPNFDKVMSGALEQNPVISNNGLTMDITQTTHNAVIKWNSFDVGGSATVNFWGPDNHNTLNYVNSANMSQIYGTINANNNGNIFIVNPAGVQIGNSAQINVGSLYVSNSKLTDDALKAVDENNINFDFNAYMKDYGAHTDAALMSLGNINANNVTFEGNGRIVIDSERLINGNNSMGAANINIETAASNTGNIVIGYDGYDETTNSYNTAGTTAIAKVNGQDFAQNKGYMWVEDVEQLQAIGKNAESLTGNYALRNSIDATGTEQSGFNPIGLNNYGKVIINNEGKYGFSGKFDGIDYNIFGLNINQPDETNVGLFGVAHDANINNVTLVGGSITGGSVVGSVVGAALGNTHITNATNSASVTGNTDVGGIVGYSGDELDNVGDSGSDITGIDTNSHFTNLVSTGIVHSKGESDGNGGIVSNAGGLIGYMYNGKLDGNSYNLGDVSGDGYNVGGLVGHAENSTIGDGTNLVYNRLDVEGAYNVGGIVGNMKGTTVQNAENSGNVLATGYKTEDYTYHTANTNFDNAYGENGDGIGGVKVNVANVGGIVGTSSASDGKASQIKNVTNTANVSSNTGTYNEYGTQNEYYTAGNVGGIVGRAENTYITNATNQENEIRGAHNVGGVAGYFGGEGTIDGGINDGGDIMATGARAAAGVIGNVVNGNGFAREHVRGSGAGSETFIVGNMGGVVGYMEGNDVYVTGSANRGTVHSQDINNPNQVLNISQAANTGGVVGKIDRNKINDEDGNILTNEDILAGIKDGSIKAAVTDSYNTGDVRGYTGVGGVIGMMYNGEVADSYNLGNINTTRQPVNLSNRDSVNMGGVVGDTTEESNASAVLYNVYNSGQIGDETYTNYARHVGGVVGRLSGTVDKAYNTGAIYNGYSVVGGIAGWFYEGTISNAFNTGNITVNNKETGNAGSQVGGIAGGISGYSRGTNRIYNAYNLGTLRSFSETTSNPNQVGGIVGQIVIGNGAQTSVEIKNVYTTSNIYSATGSGAGIIYGKNGIDQNLTIEGANYIDLDSTNFTDISETNKNNEYSGSAINKVAYDDRYKSNAYNFVNLNTGEKIWANVDGTTVSDDGYWRIYNNGKTGTTPILNAFLPDSENYFAQNGLQDATGTFEGSVQYGTAYDPLLTIIKNNSNRDLSFEIGTGKKQLSISNAAGIAVYGSGLTLKGFTTNNGTGYFGGIIYSEGALTIKAAEKEDVGFGKGTKIYGSSVTLNADGTITVYGDITATGESGDSDINITSGENVDIYGTLTSVAVGEETNILGILDSSLKDVDFGNISDKDSAVTNIGNRFTHTSESKATGNINIVAGKTDEDGKVISGGNANLYFGNQEDGLITTGGDLTVTGAGDVYVDSDLNIGGNLTLAGTGAESEVVLDITNIGQVQADNGTVTNALTGLHNFMHHFENNKSDTDKLITLNSASGDAKLAVDMWNYGTGAFDLNKYDDTEPNGHTLLQELQNLNISASVIGNDGKVTTSYDAQDSTYIWVSSGEQLKNIQTYYKTETDAGRTTGILGYNFALKNDINASDVEDYVAIGTESEFTGTFDGRGNRIIGLDTTKYSNGGNSNTLTNAGIFSSVGKGGVVKDVNIYSGTFTGTTTAGAVAGENNGRIEGIVTFGNTVTSNGNAGGIVGVNNSGGTVDDVESTGSVIAGSSSAVAGGLVGTNDGGLSNSFSDSAVTVDTNVTSGTSAGLGGVVGINNGNVQYVDSLGVTNGGATNSSNIGGIIGINNGNMYSGYNESIVSGKDNVGGIIGENSTGGTVTNIVNATSVTGENVSADNVSQYVGGLVGSNSGSVTNGRNNGTITGTNYVGGMVGSNAQGATLTNLVNDSSAAIEGENYVGGIAGSNSGTITADKENDNLVNRGSITGNKFVGGVAGVNEFGGTIANTLNSVVLHAKGENAQYFGGVVGQNSGEINGATNTSNIDITAVGGSYVGGIIGQNTKSGTLKGEIRNEGSVAGKSQVGGIIGENDNDYVLIGTEGNRLTVENDGSVDAQEGGAAGIFYENHGEIKYADISNSGVVNGGDKEGGTGGLFGINTGNITESTLTNSGTVIGGGIVGGLIGKNSGDAFNSSLTNTGSVIGKSDVGGLIGYNTGTVTGGRNKAQETDKDGKVTAEKDSYYKYQIYNNGVVNVGTWNDKNSNGKVDDGEITGLQQGETSQNIGGLIGNNADEIATGGKKGSLTAGYNTGVINASGSTNVGGIAGSNSGKIDQVFNTVMVKPGSNQDVAIKGGTNVGGLVGTNSGTLSNAYNTTDVFGNSVFGNAVGNNTAKGTIKNIYASNNSGKLIGENINQSADAIQKAYSFVNGDTSATKIISGEDQKDSCSYAGFDFANGTWKNYDENGNPLLKVFLTDVTINVDVDKINKYINNVYNGDAQYITDEDIDKLIAQGAITAPDDFTAYKNAKELINSISHADAGTYNDWLYSGQIASSGSGETFNPNNLGYDIVLTASIAQAELSISDILANIVYGGNTYTDIAGGSLTGIINNDDVYLRDKNGNKISITSDLIADYLSGDYAANKGNRNTADVKRDQNNNVIAYEDAISVDGISLGGTASGNYKLTDTTISGDITVTPATLNITLNDIYRIYGDHKTIYSNYDATQTGDYGIKNVSGLVNGDQDNLKNLIVKAISDGALDDYANPTKTNDVTKDGYKWTGEFSGIDNVNSNYTITVDGGNSIVKAKTITIKDLLASIVYGNQDNKGLQINTGASLADGSIVYGDDLDVSLVVDNAQYTTGGAYEDNKGGRTTADVGEYTNSLFVSGLSLTGDKAGNYVLDTTAAVGDIKVTKANLIINVGNAETVYGDAFNDYDYTHTLSGVTNGDSDTVIDGLLGGNYDNTVSVEAGKDTANAGTYKDALGFVNYQQLKNYDVQVENGDVIINKKQITIGANNEQIFVGETPNYSGTDINGVLVNGDSLNGNYHYGVADGTVESVTGTHTGVIGIWIGGVFYDLSQNVDWTQAGSFFSNYEVNSTPGTLTVSAYDIPEDWPHNRWDYLFNDAPFDRNKDFRERKAEVNFVDGGMEI